MACFLGLGGAIWLGFGPPSLLPAALVLAGVIPFVLLREYARRFAFAHLALTLATTIDVVVAVLQLAALLALCQFGLLSVAAVYGAMGVACAAACLCWWLLDRQPMRFSFTRVSKDWWRNWSFGKWAMMSQMTGLAAYVLPWLLASVRGEAETGQLAACGTLVGLSNLFVIGLNNFLMPKAALAFVAGGPRASAACCARRRSALAVVLGGLCLAVLLGGNLLAETVFGSQYAHTGPLIAMLALATLTDAIGLMAGIGLWAMDRPAASIAGDVVQLVATLGVALWLVFPLGAMGIAAALVIGRSAGAAVRWLTIRMLLDEGQRKLSTA